MENHTFVIPVYKESPYLEDCIKSLLDQTVKSKIIITTPTPTNRSRELASAYGIPYFVKTSEGTDVASNWNFALSKTNTNLVTIAHQDDVYERKYTEIVIKKITDYNKKSLLIAFTDYVDLVNGMPRKFSV